MVDCTHVAFHEHWCCLEHKAALNRSQLHGTKVTLRKKFLTHSHPSCLPCCDFAPRVHFNWWNVLHSPTKLKSSNLHLPFGDVTEVPEVRLWGLNEITEAPYPLLKKRISFCFLTFCLLWTTAKNGNSKDNKWELKICAEWLGCMGPQAAGGVAQVGRSWEGDRRGKRDREVGWRQTWRDRERHLHRERHRQRDGEIEAGQQRTREGQTERTETWEHVGEKYTHTQG